MSGLGRTDIGRTDLGDPILRVDVRRARPSFDLRADFASSSRSLGLFGPSGAGKSTLLSILAGLDREARGRITFEGDVWLDGDRAARPEQRDIGYVPQDDLLFPHLDVRGNLLAGARRARRRGLDTDQLLDNAIEVLELAPLLGREIDALSGGERRRVALGRALVSGPRLLLLDEPLAGLDLKLRQRVLPLLARLRDVLAVPMILVSHEPTEIRALCAETVVLDQGRVIAHGPTDDTLSDPTVLPLAAARGFESLLEARIAPDATADFGCVTLGRTSVRLVTPPTGVRPGSRVWIGIQAHDVMLAVDDLGVLSARNRLPARVVSVDPLGRGWLVRCQVADDVAPIAAQLTTAARDELEIVPGREVIVVVKAHACRLYER